MTDKHAIPDVIAEHFRPVIGLPAWHVHRGHGSFLTLEFGQPHLRIYGPGPRTLQADRLGPTRRLVVAKGEWHLWIYCCAWQVFQDDRLIAHSESSDAEITDAPAVLNGQIIQTVSLAENTAQTTFTFDLGATLLTAPYGKDDEDEQWFLYEPGNTVLAVRADAQYMISPKKHAAGDATWRALWPGSAGSA
jgi:hypothetical protein